MKKPDLILLCAIVLPVLTCFISTPYYWKVKVESISDYLYYWLTAFAQLFSGIFVALTLSGLFQMICRQRGVAFYLTLGVFGLIMYGLKYNLDAFILVLMPRHSELWSFGSYVYAVPLLLTTSVVFCFKTGDEEEQESNVNGRTVLPWFALLSLQFYEFPWTIGGDGDNTGYVIGQFIGGIAFLSICLLTFFLRAFLQKHARFLAIGGLVPAMMAHFMVRNVASDDEMVGL
jgi:hypothetical protein